MENGNKPINPVHYDGKPLRETEVFEVDCNGLTKREYFAAMAMQGLLADPSPRMFEWIIKNSVVCADLLLKELEKQN